MEGECESCYSIKNGYLIRVSSTVAFCYESVSAGFVLIFPGKSLGGFFANETRPSFCVDGAGGEKLSDRADAALRQP